MRVAPCVRGDLVASVVDVLDAVCCIRVVDAVHWNTVRRGVKGEFWLGNIVVLLTVHPVCGPALGVWFIDYWMAGCRV